MVVAVGITSHSSSSRFGATSTFNEVTPVTLPPGLPKLATSPSWIGSADMLNTIGMVVVAGAACAGGSRRT